MWQEYFINVTQIFYPLGRNIFATWHEYTPKKILFTKSHSHYHVLMRLCKGESKLERKNDQLFVHIFLCNMFLKLY